jgi:hypothetical protein
MKCSGRFSRGIALVLVVACLEGYPPEPTAAQGPKKDKISTLEMSKAVACKKIEGYEDFQLLPNAALTSEDKLQVYYRPIGYKVETIEKPKTSRKFRAKFSQDGRIRKKGEKTVVMKKDRILEYDPTFDDATQHIYLVNNVGLKGLPPGDYEYDITLRDDLTEGAVATQTLPFTIIPVPKFDPPKTDEPDEPEGSTGSKPIPKTGKNGSKTNGSR